MRVSLKPEIEAAALRETEDALRELMQTAQNCGMGRASLVLMLRAVADELDPPIEVEYHTVQ